MPINVPVEPKRHQEPEVTVHAEQPQVKKTRRKGPTSPPAKRLEDLNRVYAVCSLVEFPDAILKKTHLLKYWELEDVNPFIRIRLPQIGHNDDAYTMIPLIAFLT